MDFGILKWEVSSACGSYICLKFATWIGDSALLVMYLRRILSYRCQGDTSNHLIRREAGLRQVIAQVSQPCLYVMQLQAKDSTHRILFCRDPRRWTMPRSGGVLSEGDGHSGPGVCLGDGQTEAEGIPSQDGRGDALLRRMSPYLIWPVGRFLRMTDKSAWN